jgi:hypothetical protein
MKKPLKYWIRRESRKTIIIGAYSIAQAVRMMATKEWCNTDYIRNYFYDVTDDGNHDFDRPMVKINDEIVAEEPAVEIKSIYVKTKFKIVMQTSTYSKKNGAVPRRETVAKNLSMDDALKEMKRLTGKALKSYTVSGGVFPKTYTIE